MNFIRRLGTKLSVRSSKVASLDPVHQLLQEAHAHLLSEEYDKARDLLLQTIESRSVINEPATVDYILMSLETTWLLTGKFADGISFFSDYLSRRPGDPCAYGGRADLLWYSGRLEEAIQDFGRSLEMRPNGFLSLSGRGQVLAEVGRAEKALEDLDLAL